MDWIFENLGKLAPLALFLFYLLSALKGRKNVEEEELVDPEAADRARRIQEEIRRKILERQKGASSERPTQAPAEVERDRRFEPMRQEPEPYNPFEPERPLHERQAARSERAPEPRQRSEEAILLENQREFEQQQRQIQEKLEKARELRDAARLKQRQTYERQTAPHVSGSQIGPELIRDFKNVSLLRRAIVAKEILDTPVGLRREPFRKLPI